MTVDTAVKSAPTGGLTFIEQLHARAIVEICPAFNVPFLIGVRRQDKKIVLTRGACGLWSCVVCGARNGKRWLARIINHMNRPDTAKNWYFVTITAHENWRGAELSSKNLRQGWKKLYNRMLRKYGKVEYVKVWEFHEDNSFHMHLLVGRKIGKRWWKDNARSCGMGYQADSVQAKNPGQVAGYCAKYLLKSFEHADKYIKGTRRIEVSRDWTKLPELTSDIEEWVVSFSREAQLKKSEAYKRERFSIVDHTPTDQAIMKTRYELKY